MLRTEHKDFPSGPLAENLPANVGNTGSMPGLEMLHTLSGPTKPMCHDYWALTAEAGALQQEKPLHEKLTPQPE